MRWRGRTVEGWRNDRAALLGRVEKDKVISYASGSSATKCFCDINKWAFLTFKCIQPWKIRGTLISIQIVEILIRKWEKVRMTSCVRNQNSWKEKGKWFNENCFLIIHRSDLLQIHFATKWRRNFSFGVVGLGRWWKGSIDLPAGCLHIPAVCTGARNRKWILRKSSGQT